MFRHLFVLLLLIVFAVPVGAQQNIDSYRKDLPTFEPMPENEFLGGSEIFKEVPFGDEFLSYEIRLPKKWKQYENQSVGGFSLSDKVLGEVARYYGPARITPRSYVSIEAADLEYKLTAEQWYIQFLLANGYPSQGIKVYDRDKVEGLYVVVDKDITYLVRNIAVTNGKRIVFLRYFLPSDEWMGERAQQASVVQSFKLMNSSDALAEEMKRHHFLDISEIQYPASWHLRAPSVKSVDRINVSLLSSVVFGEGRKQSEVLNGRMGLEMISSFVIEDLEQEVQKFKTLFNNEGNFKIGDLIEEPDDFDFDDTAEFGFVEVYKVSDPSKPQVSYEYWLSIIAIEDYYYFVSLLTPSRDQDFVNWSRNTEAFKIVNRYIRPQDERVRAE